jgi:hypothetical protein
MDHPGAGPDGLASDRAAEVLRETVRDSGAVDERRPGLDTPLGYMLRDAVMPGHP